MSDYANLFAQMYKVKNGVSRIYPSQGAPVCLELIVYAFGELGKPNFSNLIEKVQKHLLEDRELHDLSQQLGANLDWKVKRIPESVIENSISASAQGQEVSEENGGRMQQNNDILNGQYLHLYTFLMKLEKAMSRDSYFVTSSPLYQINNELADIETKIFNVNKRLDFNNIFKRIYQEDQRKLQTQAKLLGKKQPAPSGLRRGFQSKGTPGNRGTNKVLSNAGNAIMNSNNTKRR